MWFCHRLVCSFTQLFIHKVITCLESTCWGKCCCCCLLISCVQLFATPWTAASQASLSFPISQSLLKFMSIESVILSNHRILYHLLLLLLSIFPNIRVFSKESALFIRWPRYWSFRYWWPRYWSWASAAASVLPMNIQGWFPLGLSRGQWMLFRGIRETVVKTNKNSDKKLLI